VYPQSGWKVLKVREVRTREVRNGRTRLVTLRLSHLGTFKVLSHRDFPLVKRVVVKLTPSGRLYISFLMEYHFPKLEDTGKVVALDVGVEELLVTSDGEYSPNLRPYEQGSRQDQGTT